MIKKLIHFSLIVLFCHISILKAEINQDEYSKFNIENYSQQTVGAAIPSISLKEEHYNKKEKIIKSWNNSSFLQKTIFSTIIILGFSTFILIFIFPLFQKNK